MCRRGEGGSSIYKKKCPNCEQYTFNVERNIDKCGICQTDLSDIEHKRLEENNIDVKFKSNYIKGE